MNSNTEEQLKENAIKRVDFKHHFLIYVVVIAFLWAIWAATGSGYMWPVWPTGGWGIAIFFHYVGAFNPFNLFSVEKEIEKLKKERG
ncbi:MAG: 2TM domain-containing protein [Cyclobacteriaceae bacterium]